MGPNEKPHTGIYNTRQVLFFAHCFVTSDEVRIFACS